MAREKAREEIDEESRIAEEEAVRDCADRGILQSGIFGGKIASIHRERAKRMVDRQIALRRETLKQAPEAATEENFKSLLDYAYATIDRVLESISERLTRRGFQVTTDDVRPKDEFEAHALKAHSNREIEILKREHKLRVSEQEMRLPDTGAKDKRKVWVVHGRNLDARDAMRSFLRSIGLEPMEWGEALALTGKGTPYTGEVLDHAFAEAQAVVVLLTATISLVSASDSLTLTTRPTKPTSLRRPERMCCLKQAWRSVNTRSGRCWYTLGRRALSAMS